MSTKTKRTVAIIQARMGSERLPGKVLRPILGRPALFYVIQRVRAAESLDKLVVATTELPQDDPIALFCKEQGVACFRGSEVDVLDRYVQAAKAFSADSIVRLTADNLVIDPRLIDQVAHHFAEGSDDYVSNCLHRTFPRGQDVEIFSRESLQRVAKQARSPAEREHVTLRYYTHPEEFHLGEVQGERDLSLYRLTLDTEEDFAVLSFVLEKLYPKDPLFPLSAIVALFEKFPEKASLNSSVKQKEP